jgi:hypothetical protein
MQENTLKIEEGRVYELSELVKLGLDKESFVKSRTQGHISLMDQLVFHDKTYFEGMTFELIRGTTKFRAEANDLGSAHVNRLMTIRKIEWDIKGLENTIWGWKFDFDMPEKIPPLEARLAELKNELLMQVKRTVRRS